MKNIKRPGLGDEIAFQEALAEREVKMLLEGDQVKKIDHSHL
jgi:hypothetical protein